MRRECVWGEGVIKNLSHYHNERGNHETNFIVHNLYADAKIGEILNISNFLDMNQDQIAKHFKVSQVQISRMEKRIIEKLKKQFN